MRIRILLFTLMRIRILPFTDADLDPSFQFDPDLNPTTHFFLDFDSPVPQNDPPRLLPVTLMRIRILLFTLMGDPDQEPAVHFYADPDPDQASQNDADPYPQHCFRLRPFFEKTDGSIEALKAGFFLKLRPIIWKLAPRNEKVGRDFLRLASYGSWDFRTFGGRNLVWESCF